MIGLVILILATAVPVVPDTTRVSTVEEFQEAVRQARPGDTIVMANGTWHDADLVFDADGAEGDSITVRAESPVEVILTGRSRLRIGGKYLKVEGLWFHRGALERGHVIAFRTDRMAHHSRVTNCAVTEYNPANWLLQYKWVSLYGTYNRVDHCYFAGKTHDGATFVVWLEDPPNDTPNHHRVDQNHFGPRPELGKNGGETIRIGTSSRSMQDSYTVVEHNLFERTDGEHEIISNKSGHNTYRHNTFLEAQGALTLRHGNHAVVRENWFLGRGKPGTGGVRIIGEDHTVVHNYFSELKGDSSRSTLSVMNGIPNSPLNRYFQVKRPTIARNTFIGTEVSIFFGLGADGEKTLLPENVLFQDNVLFTESDKPVVTTYVSVEDIMWRGNVFYGTQLGIPEPDGIHWEDPDMVSGPHGMQQPSPAGSASGKGASPTYPPLSPSDVGPSWWGQPWSPKIMEDTVHTLPDFSYAGYRWGADSPPDLESTLKVTDYGATGDDMNDDTEAFKRAIQAVDNQQGWVLVEIPEGRFYLSQVLFLERDSLILRGSGVGKTVISVEKPLGTMDVSADFEGLYDSLTVQGRTQSPYSSRGGVFWIRPNPKQEAETTSSILQGHQGAHMLEVSKPEVLSFPGDMRILWFTGNPGSDTRQQHFQDVTITALEGNTVYIKEPLLVNLTPELEPQVRALANVVQVGIEHLSIEFAKVPYGGHHLEDGYNALYLEDVRHGWIRNIEVGNTDAAIILDTASQVTLDEVAVRGRGGHYGIHTRDSRHVLMKNIHIHSNAVHTVGCEGSGGFNVVTVGMIGRIYDAGCIYPSLYESVTVQGNSDGILDLDGRSSPILWNAKVVYPQAEAIRQPVYLGALKGSSAIVGLSSNVPVRMQIGAGSYQEGVNWPGEMMVPSLYLHQLRQRLAAETP